MNAQKFTQKSLEAVKAAQDLAIEYQNMQIEEEHLLYALVAQENGQDDENRHNRGEMAPEKAVSSSALLQPAPVIMSAHIM